MKKNIYSLVIAAMIFAVSQSEAQDVHFSQFYTTPLHLNPAQTGFFNGSYRVAAIYKNQWASVTTPYATFSGSADFGVHGKGKKRNDIFGVGFLATTDKAGDANFTTTQFGASFSFNKKLSDYGNQYLGAGASLNFGNTHFDYSALHFDNEYFGTGSNQKIVPSTQYFDLSAGAEYNTIRDQSTYFNFGAAIFHINRPNYTFIGNSADAVLQRKLLLNTGMGILLSPALQLHPRAMFAMQGTYRELNLGSFVRVRLDNSVTPHYALYLGSWYRWKDAFIFVTRFDIDRLSIALSYDMNHSTLTPASNGLGGPEISFLYTGSLHAAGNKIISCPRF